MLDFSPLLISLQITALATAITFCLGIVAAQGMHRYRGQWRSLLDSLLLAPMVLPPTVLGFVLLWLLGIQGPLGVLLSRVGLSVVFTGYAAVITATVVAFPLMYKTVLGALEQIDDTLLQAGRTLGASEFRVFWRITLPLALPGILAGTTLAFARALGEFGATLMVAGNIPGKTQTIPMAIYFAVEAGAFSEAAVWSGVILAIALGGLVLVNRWQGREYVGRRRVWVDGQQRGSRTAEQRCRFLVWLRSSSWLVERWRSRLPRLSAPAAAPISASPQLSVTIIKHLPDFVLDLSFDTNNQSLGLLGESGAGKSLILRCIAGIETPDAGRIVLNGRVLFDSEQGINVPSCERRVGVLFQNYALFPHLTVAQNIAFGLPRPLCHRQQHQIVAAQLAAVQLQGMGDRYPSALSGGQQQRVAMARVLASQSEVLLLDEPFAALDTHLRSLMERDFRLWLGQFAGVTLLVTHNIEEAYRLCDNLLVIEQGRAITHDCKSMVLAQPQTVGTARLTGCKNISRAVAIGASTIRALDWNCILQVTPPIPHRLTHIGIRAHQLGFLDAISQRTVVMPQGVRELAPGGHWGQTIPDPANQIIPLDSPPATPNTFPCWLAMTSETPHRMALYLKLQDPPTDPQDYHLQAEVFKEKWAILQKMPFPWAIVLVPERLILLSND